MYNALATMKPTDDAPATSSLAPAGSLEEIFTLFDPTLEIDPSEKFYIPRTDHGLRKLSSDLLRSPNYLHAFLCGHSGSGKTTELKRLVREPEILERFLPIFLTGAEFGETVHLTHDALLVEIGLALTRFGKPLGLDSDIAEKLDTWGREVVKTFYDSKAAEAEAGAEGNAWIAWFKATLSTRREWSTEKKQVLEPRVQDLMKILDEIAQDLKNRSGRRILVVVDDLEKGESDAHKAMHTRLFEESYDVLVQPRFSIVYTLPIYFRALAGSRIPQDRIYAFSAARLYGIEEKAKDRPPLDHESPGYKLMRQFVEARLADPAALIAPDALDPLLRIGGGLFRETARSVRDAAYFVELRGGSRIEAADAEQVFNQVKKEYQPMIRGEAVAILKAVLARREGWVPGVEPYLQSRAVVEYENGDLWLDLRSVLKRYVRELEDGA